MRLDFNSFYQQLLVGKLGELEADRKKYIRKFWTELLLSLALIVTGIYLIVYQDYSNHKVMWSIWLAFGVALIMFIVMGYSYARFYNPFRQKFKQFIVPEIVKYVDKRLSYSATSSMMDVYHQSGIFTRGYDRYKAEDTIVGTFAETSFAFGEVHTEYKTVTTNSKGQRQEQWHTIFKGIMFVSEFNKNFNGTTYLDADRMEKALGWLGRKFQRWNSERKGELLQMENPAFEKFYAVYSTDEQEARYILSLSMMEKLVKLRNEFQFEIYVAFLNNQLYMALFNNKNTFEPKVFGMIFSEKECLKLVSLLESITGIVEELKLNTRIWTKE